MRFIAHALQTGGVCNRERPRLRPEDTNIIALTTVVASCHQCDVCVTYFVVFSSLEININIGNV